MPDADAAILLSELRHVVQDLQDLVGVPCTDAWVPTPTSVVLRVGRVLLYVESHPAPRLHLVDRRPPSPPAPYSFQGLLRARVRGPLESLTLVGDDRVIEIRAGGHTLHARLFGRGGGLWLLEGDRVIAASDGPAPDTLPPLAPLRVAERPPRFSPAPGERWGEAAGRFLGALAERTATEALRRRLLGHLGRLVARDARLLDALHTDLAGTERADMLRHLADCLAAALYRVPRGLREVEVPDLLAPDASVTVPLDPSRTPAENLGRLYDKAKRLERAVDHVLGRIEETEARHRALVAAREEAATAPPERLRALAEEVRLPAPAARRIDRPAAPWATWRGPRGETLLVGRSDAGNHALVFRRARGRDWWVHVRDRPGAHVVVPTAREATPPLELLLAAAQLALRASRAPEGTSYDVQYARVADVRPLKGAGPGRVQVRDERVLHVRAEPGLLEGWSREDEA